MERLLVRQAVVQVDAGVLVPGALAEGVPELARRGFALHRYAGEHGLELVVESADPADARRRTVEACAAVYGSTPTAGTVTFISRGTDEDARGVLDGFGVQAVVERTSEEDDEEVLLVTIPSAERRRVPESRLHTALEAALNCEIRIRFD